MKLNFWRAFANLRRIALELKRANDLTESRLSLEHPDWKKRARTAKLVVHSTASVENWNKRYAELHPQEPEE